eukprot:302700_1
MFPVISLQCDDANYVGTMSREDDDELYENEFITSPNCMYIVREEMTRLSMYEISNLWQQMIVKDWNNVNIDRNVSSIWSINSQIKPETVSLSDSGCLSWFSIIMILLTNFVMMKFCNHKH